MKIVIFEQEPVRGVKIWQWRLVSEKKDGTLLTLHCTEMYRTQQEVRRELDGMLKAFAEAVNNHGFITIDVEPLE